MQSLVALLLAAAPAGTGAMVDAAVLDHAVRKGDRLDAQDFRIERKPAIAARGAVTREAASGMEAIRAIPAGAIVRASDIAPAQLVRRGEAIVIRILNGPLAITTAGRALGGGAKGDTVRVVTNATSRTLDGQIESAGTVRIINP